MKPKSSMPNPDHKRKEKVKRAKRERKEKEVVNDVDRPISTSAST